MFSYWYYHQLNHFGQEIIAGGAPAYNVTATDAGIFHMEDNYPGAGDATLICSSYGRYHLYQATDIDVFVGMCRLHGWTGADIPRIGLFAFDGAIANWASHIVGSSS